MAGQQTREEVQDQPVAVLRVRAGQLDRLLRPAPVLQQLGPGPGSWPPARRDVRTEHVQRLLVLPPVAEQPRPLQRAEPLPTPGLELHFPLVAKLQKPGHQR